MASCRTGALKLAGAARGLRAPRTAGLTHQGLRACTPSACMHGPCTRMHTHAYTRARPPARSTPVETFISIYSQESQYRVIKTNHHHKARVDEYLARCWRPLLRGMRECCTAGHARGLHCPSCSMHGVHCVCTQVHCRRGHPAAERVRQLPRLPAAAAHAGEPPARAQAGACGGRTAHRARACHARTHALPTARTQPRPSLCPARAPQCIGDVLKCPSLLPGLLPLEALPQASTSSARHAQPPGSSSSHQDNGARAAGGASGSGAQAAGGGSSSGSAASGSAGGSGGVAAGTELVARLQRDVGRCTLADCSYSPYADVAKQATGGCARARGHARARATRAYTSTRVSTQTQHTHARKHAPRLGV